MSDHPLYLFLLKQLQIEIPYTKTTIRLFSPWTIVVSFGSCLLYLFLITAVFPLFTSKISSRWANRLAKYHHALMFFYSLLAFLAALYHLINTGEITSWSRFVCTPLPSWLRVVSITFTLSKLWEWFDTAILIWKGNSLRKIGFLHIYHHATTFLLFLNVMNFPGPEKSGMLLNGFVHTLMYYHFAFRLPKFVRPMITTLQIVQLVTVIYIWCIVPSLCPAFKHFHRENVFEFFLPAALVPVYCLFFFKFFVEQYLISSSKKVKASLPKQE